MKKVIKKPFQYIVIFFLSALFSCPNENVRQYLLDFSVIATIPNRSMIAIGTPSSTVSYIQSLNGTTSFYHTLNSFSIGQYEVSYRLWYNVRVWAETNGYYFEHMGTEGSGGITGAKPTPNCLQPVTTLCVRDAMVWCNAYSHVSGLKEVYFTDPAFTLPLMDSRSGSYSSSLNTTPGSSDIPYVDWSSPGYRLPTEGEWQYAASNEGTTPYNYASGATFDVSSSGATSAVAWYSFNAGGATHDIGTRAPNALGLYDMSGNAYELCWDWWTDLTPMDGMDLTNYRGGTTPPASTLRIIRGGGYNYGASNMSVAYRNQIPAWDFGANFGFRVARSN